MGSPFERVHGLTVVRHNGQIYPPFWPKPKKNKLRGQADPTTWGQWLESWKQYTPRPDDVFISSYPKSGHHWGNEIVRMLRHGLIESPNIPKLQAFLEFIKLEELDQLESPRTILTHLSYQDMCEKVLNSSKIVYIYRNPKDVAVSYYYHVKEQDKAYRYKGTWDDWIEVFLSGECEYGSWFDSVIEWWNRCKDRPNVLMLSYEDLILDFQGCARKIAKFLGKSYTVDFYQNLERICSIDKMRNNKSLDTSIAYRTDKNSSMFRKGVIGDWQNHFTDEQNKKFDAIYKTRMKDCDIPIQFTMQPKYNANL